MNSMIVPGRDGRIHVTTPQMWGSALGTDFWFFASVNGMLTAGNGHELSDYGWTTTALSLAAGTGADMLSAADPGTPGSIDFGASGDLLQSPAIFGDWTHARFMQAALGYLPTQFNVEFQGLFSVHTANETTSGFGLVEAGGSPATAGDHMAYIYTDGSNFTIRSGAASDAGAADDALPHVFRIEVVAGGSITWYIDGTSQGTLALQTDLWPVSFGAHSFTTNRLSLSWVHAWYS